ncbi:MAG: EamA family transporter [Gallionellaceae bacterium]|nr:EamA family transporter [Gallionellaceae bacterium]
MSFSIFSPGIISALGAAALFGVSTPLAKLLVEIVSPVMLAGLLYLGSGTGLLLWFLWRRHRRAHVAQEAALTRRDVPWLVGTILAGGVLGPVLLMLGLSHTPASNASLLLNLEGVFTAALAWFVFKENFDRRIALGMLLIVAGGVFLTWSNETDRSATLWSLAIVAACFAWAIDNNLTRKISAGDPVQIAGIKGMVAGIVNTGIALAWGDALPDMATLAAAGILGALGYGVSLVLFVLALRHLGSARTGAYFSTAPFNGVALSLILLRETPGLLFWAAATLMAMGVWLHLTERHEHEHRHESLTHGHRHTHDTHHQHTHDFPWEDSEPHSHTHLHAPLAHSHPHYPDIHHRHGH